MFNMVRNSAGNTAWQVDGWNVGDFEMLLHNDRLLVLFSDDHGKLSVDIGGGCVNFYSGCPDDLKRALLSLTSEHDGTWLEGFNIKV